jgi:hypothetical protein
MVETGLRDVATAGNSMMVPIFDLSEPFLIGVVRAH